MSTMNDRDKILLVSILFTLGLMALFGLSGCAVMTRKDFDERILQAQVDSFQRGLAKGEQECDDSDENTNLISLIHAQGETNRQLFEDLQSCRAWARECRGPDGPVMGPDGTGIHGL